jgi:hypothetical protein
VLLTQPTLSTSAGLGKTWGRDHHPHGFTMWMAGGGMKPGITQLYQLS